MTKHRNDYQGITFIPKLEEEDLPVQELEEGRSWLTAALLISCYAAAAAAAVACTHSLTGWLVIGLAPVLLLDRLTFRVLSPTGPESTLVQLAIRASYVVLGTFGFLYLHQSAITRGEALYAGCVLTLVTFLLEYVIEWAFWLMHWVRRTSPFAAKTGPLHTTVMGVLIAMPLVVLHPLMAIHPLRTRATETPEKLELLYQDVTLRTSDGVRLAAWYVPADEPRGTVIYCHGYGENRSQVLSLLEPLHKLKLDVLAFDFRGHGDSPGHTVTFGDREVLDVQAAFDFAKQQGGERPVFLVGVSYGAAVALQALPKLHGVAGVWVDSTFGRLNSVMHRSFEFAPRFSREALVAMGSFLMWADSGMMTREISPIESIQHVRVPIYFCHNKSDRLTEFDEAQAVYEAYTGPKWHYWIDDAPSTGLSKAAHDQYFRRMQRFIERQLSGGQKEHAAGTAKRAVLPTALGPQQP
jgi:alpha-beta hydrolase superfamily lysophospholipase